MFDTHCHLNFDRFRDVLHDITVRAKKAGLIGITVPGTDIASSQKAIELSSAYDFLYAAVGIHPHHCFEIEKKEINNLIQKVEDLVKRDKVVAVGEIGLDTHLYNRTKYRHYRMSQPFFETQKELFTAQLKLATTYGKAVILHNRQATYEIIDILLSDPTYLMPHRLVFHCCQPQKILLDFAQKHHIFIGIDGDITYDKKKQEFIKHIPLDLLVLETDAPYLLPEPLRSEKKFPNEPAYLSLIRDFVADILNKDPQEIAQVTTKNAHRLFFITRK